MVYPQAIGIIDEVDEWRTTAFWELSPYPLEDIAYFDEILEDLHNQKEFKIDPKRIFVIGHSNGGLFTSSLALYNDSTKFAAICNHMGGLCDSHLPIDLESN